MMSPSLMLTSESGMPSSWRDERVVVVALVALLHALLLWGWTLQGEMPYVDAGTTRSVTIDISHFSPQPQAVPVVPQPKVKPVVEEAPVTEPEARPADVVPAAPAAPAQDTAAQANDEAEVDYRAAYLNNPPPIYPMAARRRGLEGKVILNIEVLAEGRAGQVLLHTSSGHDILDSAAMQTVKAWRFSPARHLGMPVTKWFLVPIKFSLEGN